MHRGTSVYICQLAAALGAALLLLCSVAEEQPQSRLYEVTKKTWLGEYFPEDADGGELAPDGRVMEMLSEHTLEGWLEGYLLTGRHGFFSTYEVR